MLKPNRARSRIGITEEPKGIRYYLCCLLYPIQLLVGILIYTIYYMVMIPMWVVDLFEEKEKRNGTSCSTIPKCSRF